MTSGANTKKRGAVAPGMRQVNWRVRVDLLEKLDAEAKEKGFVTASGRPKAPTFLQHILSGRYYPEPRGKGGDR